jgi:hypothetical protein
MNSYKEHHCKFVFRLQVRQVKLAVCCLICALFKSCSAAVHASDHKSGSALVLCAASSAQCYVQELPLGPTAMRQGLECPAHVRSQQHSAVSGCCLMLIYGNCP